MDDQYYIRKVTEGDSESYRHLVERYKDKAFSVAFSVLRSNSFLEDVVQDAFINAFKNLKSFRAESSFSTWLMRIVVNEAIKVLRKMKAEREFKCQISDYNETEINTSIHNLKENEQHKFIELVLNKLPHRESLILQLYYLSDYSINEIEEITNIKGDHIKVLLFRARKQFYALLQNELQHELKTLV